MSISRQGTAARRHGHGLPSRSIEFMIVLIVVLVLLLIAAQANLRAAIPAVEAYFLLTNSSYVGLDLHWLQGFDPGVKVDDPATTPAKQTATTYCVSATVGGSTWYKAGPGGPITTAAC